jgi:hypothetical protein
MCVIFCSMYVICMNKDEEIDVHLSCGCPTTLRRAKKCTFRCPKFYSKDPLFFEMETKDLPHPLIKQKRVVQLTSGKLGETHLQRLFNALK